MGTLYVEDCRVTLARPELKYNLVITSPAEYSELGMEAGDPAWAEFMAGVFEKVNPSSGVIVVVQTDRKYGGVIYQKSATLTGIMARFGWRLSSQRIWVKTHNVWLYRLGYTFILTYKRGKALDLNPRAPDVVELPFCNYQGAWMNGFPPELIRPLIERHSLPGMTVYDPFAGVGNTLIAAENCGRIGIGSEIDPKTAAKYQPGILTELMNDGGFDNRRGDEGDGSDNGSDSPVSPDRVSPEDGDEPD